MYIVLCAKVQNLIYFQSEVSSKTKKLTKLFHKLQNAEQEIKDLQVSFLLP